MGVWAIRNTTNGRMLVGASTHAQGTINRHLFTLRMGKHANAELQRDFTVLGEAAFVGEMLHVLEPEEGRTNDEYVDELAELERMWLEELRPWGEAGYHRAPTAG